MANILITATAIAIAITITVVTVITTKASPRAPSQINLPGHI